MLLHRVFNALLLLAVYYTYCPQSNPSPPNPGSSRTWQECYLPHSNAKQYAVDSWVLGHLLDLWQLYVEAVAADVSQISREAIKRVYKGVVPTVLLYFVLFYSHIKSILLL